MLSSTSILVRSAGEAPAERYPSIAEALDAFLGDLELAGRPAGTRRVYGSLLRPLRAETSIRELSPAACRAFVADRVRRQSMKTAATAYGALSSFCRYCVGQGWLDRSPLTGVPQPKPKPPAHDFLSLDELKRVWHHADSDETRLILLLLMTGLRAQELCSLRWADIDSATIRVLFTKGGKPRAVQADPDVLMLLAARGHDEGPRIFAMTTQALRQRLHRLGKRAAVPRLHPHLFRHTWATWSIRKGMDPAHVQTLGGWASDSMVRMYARSAMQDAAVDAARDFGLVRKLLDD